MPLSPELQNVVDYACHAYEQRLSLKPGDGRFPLDGNRIPDMLDLEYPFIRGELMRAGNLEDISPDDVELVKQAIRQRLGL